MNFLELVQRTCRECGVPGDGPATVLNQTREIGRIVGWVNQGWLDIQNSRPDWAFLRRSVTFNTVAGQREYEPGTDIQIIDFKKWRNDSFRQYLQSAGKATEIELHHCHSYDNFRDYYMTGSRDQVQARPAAVAITPDRKLAFGFTPDDVYVTTADYYRSAQRLVNNTDVPIIPEDYHMLIVYRAMKRYGMFNVANEIISTADQEHDELYNALLNEYGPTLEMGDSLI